jgi:hypothetical protein
VFLLVKELWHHEAMQNSAFFLDVFFLYKLSAEFQAFFKNQGGEIVVWTLKPRIAVGQW